MNKQLQKAFTFGAGALFVFTTAQAADADWVKQSNQNAMLLLKVTAQFAPEFAGRTGVDGLDDKIFDLKPDLYKRRQAATGEAVAELKKRLVTTTDPQVKQDLDILIAAGEIGRAHV